MSNLHIGDPAPRVKLTSSNGQRIPVNLIPNIPKPNPGGTT